jgi:hypothetical protein
MTKQIFLFMSGLLLTLASVPSTAQTGSSNGKTEKAWTAPKTPWGDPDLEGTWTGDDTWGVPFERPKQFGTRKTLTEDELKDRQKRVVQSEEFVETGVRAGSSPGAHSPAVAQIEAASKGEAPPPPAQGQYGRGVDAAPVPGHWGEFARRPSPATSQVVDPPDGRIPPITPEAQKMLDAKMATRRRAPQSWEDWSYYDRCITRGVAGSIIPVIYGNGLEIVQAPGYVAIRYEMVHDVRIIPLGKQEHAGPGYRSWLGDPIGHWEGNTLVVDTTNFIGKTSIGVNGDAGPPSSEEAHLVERFTRTAGNRIDYQLRVEDPKTYTAPWTVEFPITQEPGYKIFEYACHEGNMAMRNMLSAARADEAKKAAAGAAKP